MAMGRTRILFARILRQMRPFSIWPIIPVLFPMSKISSARIIRRWKCSITITMRALLHTRTGTETGRPGRTRNIRSRLKCFILSMIRPQTWDVFHWYLARTRTRITHPKKTIREIALETMPNMKKMVSQCWRCRAVERGLLAYGLCQYQCDGSAYSYLWLYALFCEKKWISSSPPQSIVNWADTPQKRQLMGIHCVAGRRSWDRTDVPYLPEHEAIAMAKSL